MSLPQRPLEPDTDEMRAIASAAVNLVIQTIAGLEGAPASRTMLDPELLAAVSVPPPEHPQPLDGLLDVTRRAAAVSYETAGPSYLAYIPGGGVFSAAVAEMLAAGLNRYTGKAALAPGFVALEQSVLRWMCDLFRLPTDGAHATLTTGGSGANLIALAAARTAHAEDQVDRATVYVGEHAHGSVAKAARTAGIARRHVRVVRSTADLRIDVEHLRACLAADREAGLIPVCVCAAAGTTNTGTIDPLAEVAQVAREAGVWFHVDAAYGGFFNLTERGRERLLGIELADSITVDPHKSLFLPYGVGALVVRSAAALRRAFAEDAAYLQDLSEPEALSDFDALGPELTREFRGLRLWLPLHLHGVDAFRRQLDEKLDLASEVYAALVEDGRFELPWAPDLSVVAFRLRDGDDDAQRRLLRRINDSQRVLLSSTRIGGRFYLRVAVLSFRTHEPRIRELLEIIAAAADAVAGSGADG